MMTEILTFQLKADASLADESSPVVEQGHGATFAYYGQLIEKPEMAVVFIGWDSIDDHEKFMSSPKYEAEVTKMIAIADTSKPITVLHVPFNHNSDPSALAFPTRALGADPKVGATELVLFYFPFTLTSSEKDGFMASVDKLRPVLERSEALGVYDGWAVEEAVPNPGPGAAEGEVCRVWVNVVGWVDVEAHMRFQATEDFQQNVHYLIGTEKMKYMEIVHTKLNKVEC